MDKKTKEDVAKVILTLLAPFIIGGLAMLANPILGCFVAAIGLLAAWSIVTWVGWFEALSRKRFKYAGYLVVVAIFLVLFLCVPGSKPNVPKDANHVAVVPPTTTTVQNNRGPTVVATAQNSPGSNPIAVGTLNGNVIVNPPDPNRDDAINRKLDAMLALPSTELRRLEQEYTLGFVLVAYSGEIDTTRIASHTDRIDGDWRTCRVYRDDGGAMHVELPHPLIFKKRGMPPFEINGPFFHVRLPARPGEKSANLVAQGVLLRVECLKQEPIGVCAAIGFEDADAQPK